MELTVEEIDQILRMNIYKMDYSRNPKPYDELRNKLLQERARLLSLVEIPAARLEILDQK